jgi:hypothetical protein
VWGLFCKSSYDGWDLGFHEVSSFFWADAGVGHNVSGVPPEQYTKGDPPLIFELIHAHVDIRESCGAVLFWGKVDWGIGAHLGVHILQKSTSIETDQARGFRGRNSFYLFRSLPFGVELSRIGRLLAQLILKLRPNTKFY